MVTVRRVSLKLKKVETYRVEVKNAEIEFVRNVQESDFQENLAVN